MEMKVAKLQWMKSKYFISRGLRFVSILPKLILCFRICKQIINKQKKIEKGSEMLEKFSL